MFDNKDLEDLPEDEVMQEIDEQVEVEDAEIEDTELDLKRQNKELEDRIHRNMAEFDNFRKRTAKEKSSIYDDAIKDTIAKLLPVIDSFERAVSTLHPDDEANKGILMIHKQFESALTSIGVETIKCVGETMDPNLHFGVSHESDDSFGEQEIIEELQKGYKYKDKVIRCSMVKVVN